MAVFSVIIPAYNEESRITDTLKEILAFPLWKTMELELIVVDDASRDRTPEIVRTLMVHDPRVKLLRGEVNRGKGFSVHRGMQEARGDHCLFVDADNSTPISEVQKLLPWVTSGAYDIAIGSRGLKSSQIKVKQGWVRRRMGKTFNWFVRWLLLKDFRDTQCGFKCFSQKAAKSVFAFQRTYRFAFDVEILVIAALQGLRIKEVPVVWINSPQSKVDPVKDAAKMLWDLVRIKANVVRGLYNKA